MAMSGDKPLRVLIAGAGVAGPALAFWLQQLGHSCTIVERWKTVRLGGQQIDLRYQGLEAVESMGIMEDIREHCVEEAGLDVVDQAGKSIFFIPRNETGSKRRAFTCEHEIMRGDLCNVLYEKTKDSVEYRFGLSVEKFEEVDNVVRVKLSDGATEEYDLVVGADGQGSRMRRAMYEDRGGDERFIRSLETFIAYFPVKRNPEDKNHATLYLETKRRLVMTRWHQPDLGQGYLMATFSHGDELRPALKQDVATQKAAFAKVFQGIRWHQGERLLKAMHSAEDFFAHEVIQVRADQWSKGRVVLLGDAAFCPSPTTGMGTSLAFIGAYVLAGEISKHKGDLRRALEAYEATLRPYVDQVQVIDNLYRLSPTSRIGISILRFLLRIASLLGLYKLLGGSKRRSYEDWKLPHYDGLCPEKAKH